MKKTKEKKQMTHKEVLKQLKMTQEDFDYEENIAQQTIDVLQLERNTHKMPTHILGICSNMGSNYRVTLHKKSLRNIAEIIRALDNVLEGNPMFEVRFGGMVF